MGDDFVPKYNPATYYYDLVKFIDKEEKEPDVLCIVTTPTYMKSDTNPDPNDSVYLWIYNNLPMDKGGIQVFLAGDRDISSFNQLTARWNLVMTGVPTLKLSGERPLQPINNTKSSHKLRDTFINNCIEELGKFKRDNANIVSKDEKINRAHELVMNAKNTARRNEQETLAKVATAVQIMAEVEYPYLTSTPLIDEENDIDDILLTKFIFPHENYRSWKPLLHIWYIVNASIIAGVGLASNSAPVVVASMLVSSMMEPIKGITTSVRYCCTKNNLGHRCCTKKSWDEDDLNMWVQTRRGCCHFLTLVGDAALCVIVGLIMGVFMCHSSDENDSRARVEILSNIIKNNNETGLILPDEMAGRATVLGLSVTCLIAAASAAALVTADQSDNKAALIGIGISASLLPPAVNAGMLWAFHTQLEDQTPMGGKYTFEIMGLLSLALTFINIGIIIVIWSVGHAIREAINKNRMKSKIERSLATTTNPMRGETKGESTPLMLDF